MKALVFDGTAHLVTDYPVPSLNPGWALIKVIEVGICRTDIELIKGYMNFKGVLGHEFVGRVEQCDDKKWVGKRVVGEINVACGKCTWCRHGMGRHCPNRSVLGIDKLDGCFAEYCQLPVTNLKEVPKELADDVAVFAEPISAAYEIIDQGLVKRADRCVVLGDGKIGILCAWVAATITNDVTLVGHHPIKLALAEWGGVKTIPTTKYVKGDVDVVIEATGSIAGLAEAIRLCRPRGTIVLKSTIADQTGGIDLSPLVIKELSVVGSRCGVYSHGMVGLIRHNFPVTRLISARFPLEEAEEALEFAARPDSLKIIITMGSQS